jgi:hypothetical protein
VIDESLDPDASPAKEELGVVKSGRPGS